MLNLPAKIVVNGLERDLKSLVDQAVDGALRNEYGDDEERLMQDRIGAPQSNIEIRCLVCQSIFRLPSDPEAAADPSSDIAIMLPWQHWVSVTWLKAGEPFTLSRYWLTEDWLRITAGISDYDPNWEQFAHGARPVCSSACQAQGAVMMEAEEALERVGR